MQIDKNMLKKFGITMGVILATLTLLVYFRRHQVSMPLAVISVLFLLSGYFLPFALKLVYIFWMKLAAALSWINTRLILILIFYLVFTPLGLLMRMLGRDLLERRLERSSVSYWKKKESENSTYERQF